MRNKYRKITQREYAEILFNDLGFTPTTRRIYLETYYGKSYLDELTTSELSKIIGEFKDRKERGKTQGDQEEDE